MRALLCSDFTTQCMYVAANGHQECVQTLLRYMRTNHIDSIDSLGRTPLMMAVQNGHLEIVNLLIDQGANVSYGDRHLRTALHRAVSVCVGGALCMCVSVSVCVCVCVCVSVCV